MTETNLKPKKIAPGSVRLQFAGDMVLAKRPDPSVSGLFQRFDHLFELLANQNRTERLLNYKMLNGLMLTSHARKAPVAVLKQQLFELKNQVFLDVANNLAVRKTLKFAYLTSKQRRVLEFCATCIEKNTAAGTEKFKWTSCRTCKLDANFFNVLSMQHDFKDGFFRMFISHEHIDKISDLKILKKEKLGALKEEGLYKKYHYNTQTLDAFDLDSVLKFHQKLIATKL